MAMAVAPSTRDQEFYAIIYLLQKKEDKYHGSLPARSKVRHVMWVTSNEVGFDLHHHLLLRLVDYSLRKVQ